MKHKFILLSFMLAGLSAFAQMQVPGKKQDALIVLMNGRAHIGNGQVIENSAIGFENGKIIFVGDATTMRLDLSKAKVIDVYGKEVYPGLISANTHIGLREIEMVRATNDFSEVGTFNPCVRTIISYNTDSKVTPTIRSNGVLLAQIVPQGGIISGQSSVVQLDAWNWEDAAYKTDEGIHLQWPSYFKYQFDENGDATVSQNKNYQQEVDLIKKYVLDAKAYCSVVHIEKDLQSEAMCGLFNGSKKLYIHASLATEINAAVLFAKDMNVPCVIVGGRESWKCTRLLKENNVPVILHRNQALPPSADDDYDIAYKTPYLLESAGVLYCNSTDNFWQERNLPFNASQPVPYGLKPEEALKSITLNAAKILGIEHVTGTLESGKDANIVVSDGDILDMKSNKVVYAFIQGRQVDLNNKQKDLYEIYMKKYGLMK
jgi:imidazolonepropionase-like amidohydrolase